MKYSKKIKKDIKLHKNKIESLSKITNFIFYIIFIFIFLF